MFTPTSMIDRAKNAASLARTRREAIKWVREEANAIIAQNERLARGWDKGMYRDDDVLCDQSIRYTQAMRSLLGFALARNWV